MQNRTGRKRGLKGCMALAGMGVALCLSGAGLFALSAEAAPGAEKQPAVSVQMPGFVVEQWSMPKPMKVVKDARVQTLADENAATLGNVTAGQELFAWGQTDTGWYFVQWQDTLGYIRQDVAAFADGAQPGQTGEAAEQPVQAAGSFLSGLPDGDIKGIGGKGAGKLCSRGNRQNGSRYEWFHDTAIPQADKIIGSGSRVVINMGVNDLNDADKYAQDMNYWGAVWSARGAQVYYASVNPVWENPHGMTQERVKLFNDRLKSAADPQITWLDSHNYLLGTGVHAYDGIHYKDDTNLVLYHYYLTMIGAV